MATMAYGFARTSQREDVFEDESARKTTAGVVHNEVSEIVSMLQSLNSERSNIESSGVQDNGSTPPLSTETSCRRCKNPGKKISEGYYSRLPRKNTESRKFGF